MKRSIVGKSLLAIVIAATVVILGATNETKAQVFDEHYVFDVVRPLEVDDYIPIMLEAIKKLEAEIGMLRTSNDSLKYTVDYLLERVNTCCPKFGDGGDSLGGGKKTDPVDIDSLDPKEDLPPVDPNDTLDPKDPPPVDPEDPPHNPVDSLGTGMLFENQPNPFNSSTEIRFYIPVIAHTAFIIIYDLGGVELMKFDVINPKGFSSITIENSSLMPGTYVYALTINDKQVDSKQMILTK